MSCLQHFIKGSVFFLLSFLSASAAYYRVEASVSQWVAVGGYIVNDIYVYLVATYLVKRSNAHTEIISHFTYTLYIYTYIVYGTLVWNPLCWLHFWVYFIKNTRIALQGYIKKKEAAAEQQRQRQRQLVGSVTVNIGSVCGFYTLTCPSRKNPYPLPASGYCADCQMHVACSAANLQCNLPGSSAAALLLLPTIKR